MALILFVFPSQETTVSIGRDCSLRGGTQIFPEFEYSAQTRHSSGFCH